MRCCLSCTAGTSASAVARLCIKCFFFFFFRIPLTLPQLPVKASSLLVRGGASEVRSARLHCDKVPRFKSGRKDRAPLDPVQKEAEVKQNTTKATSWIAPMPKRQWVIFHFLIFLWGCFDPITWELRTTLYCSHRRLEPCFMRRDVFRQLKT